MASIQERLQIKREPLDKWSIREKLCLASAVARSGDQNWMSVSRAIKPFGEPNRPQDWFHQKNCAAQYGALLENVETPKRKKRISGGENIMETPGESILRKLTQERKEELRRLMAEAKAEYQRLQSDLAILHSNNVNEEQLDMWCKEIDEEEKRKEQEALTHSQWLKERECRKQEIERAWKPVVKSSPMIQGQKRKMPDSLDAIMESDIVDEVLQHHQQQHIVVNIPEATTKPALSPLLTSLLKSPSQAPNINTSSILHTAITSQRPVNTTTNPTIASLLNSSPTTAVSPSLQHLVSTALSSHEAMVSNANNVTANINLPAGDLLEDATDTLPNLKMEDIESTILSSDDPLPEIKNEEVEVIISDLIENADDIVNDPEQHLKLDDDDDIITNLDNELKELGEDDIEQATEEEQQLQVEMHNTPPIPTPSPAPQIIASSHAPTPASHAPLPVQHVPAPPPISPAQLPPAPPVVEKEMPKVDPFEFEEEEPEVLQPLAKHQAPVEEPRHEVNLSPTIPEVTVLLDESEIKKEIPDERKEEADERAQKSGAVPGSVEIVEVVVMEDDEVEKQLNKSQIENIVHSHKPNADPTIPAATDELKPEEQVVVKQELEEEHISLVESTEFNETFEDNEVKDELKNVQINVEDTENLRRNTFTPEYSEEYFDDLNMSVTKPEKTGKAKRDYSRTKKKEEKDFDILLAVEKAVSAQLEENDLTEDTFSDKEFRDVTEKKYGGVGKIKSENERSNSPWTEDEELSNLRYKRRYSSTATPVDSVPNSPASSITYCDDDRDYRTWKKSVMLIYGHLAAHKYASLFLKPITDEQAPGYHSIVSRPMDLQTIRKNIESGVIRTTAEFQRDVLLMFNNAIMYNKTNNLIYNMAIEMQQEAIQHLKQFVQAQGQGDVPLRRETRTSEPGSKRKRVSEDLASRVVKKRKED